MAPPPSFQNIRSAMPRRRRSLGRASARVLTAPELGSGGLASTRSSLRYPVELSLSGGRATSLITAALYPSASRPEGEYLPLHPVPFRSVRRAVFHAPQGELRWAVWADGEVVGEGRLFVHAIEPYNGEVSGDGGTGAQVVGKPDDKGW